jgi:hypothetical protein
MARITIQELDQLPVTITLTLQEEPATPDTLRWKLDCITTQTSLVEWTSLSAASSVALIIPASSNAIIYTVNPYETKRITVQANAGTDSQINALYDYDVVNNSAYELE